MGYQYLKDDHYTSDMLWLKYKGTISLSFIESGNNLEDLETNVMQSLSRNKAFVH